MSHSMRVIERGDRWRIVCACGWEDPAGYVNERHAVAAIEVGPASMHPRPGHVVVVASIPMCDYCGQCEADWDCPTTFGGSWANLCDRCNHSIAQHPGKTGVGIGQRLILAEDIPAPPGHDQSAWDKGYGIPSEDPAVQSDTTIYGAGC